MKLTLTAQALQDGLAAREWYGEFDAGTAGPFSNALDRALALLLEYPHVGPPLDDVYRSLAVKDYPYRVVYAVDGETIRVAAIAHTSRKPRYWE